MERTDPTGSVLVRFVLSVLIFPSVLRVQRDIYAESKGFSRRERKGSCRAIDLSEAFDEMFEKLLEPV